MTRPAGLAPGALSLVSAWLASFVIAMLTGASAVVILLAIGLVGLAISTVTGRWALRSSGVVSVRTDREAVVGDALTWHVTMRTRRPVTMQLAIAGTDVATGRLGDGLGTLVGSAPARGVHEDVLATWSTAGWFGLLWWRRSAFVRIEALSVAPVTAETAATVERGSIDDETGSATSDRHGRNEVDGVRPWRDGDDVDAVHWPSSLRSGELVLRQRRRDHGERWIVRATTGTSDPSAESARVRHALERGLGASALVGVSVDGGEPVMLGTRGEILRWCASFEPSATAAKGLRWWRRAMHLTVAEPAKLLTPRARWMVAAANIAPLVMLLQPLGYGTGDVAIVLAAGAVAAAVSVATGDRRRVVRQIVGLAVAAGVAVTLIDVGAVTSVVASLRFLLPQLLVALVVLQGFECVDRRAARVSIACSALLTAYSAGVRVDATLGAWLLVACVVIGWAALGITREDRRVGRPSVQAARPHDRRTVVIARAAGFTAAALAVLAILAIVPVPKGPAQLTLPSWLEERRPTGGDGSLAAPDGSPLLGGSSSRGGGTGAAGGAGSYPGFSPSMDTSLRGDLGDAVVLRVRAPYPDFWRGQTFSRFDGRTWFVDDDLGTLTEGPEHFVRRAVGDVRLDGDADFIQTFYAEVDLPNLVFAASRPTRVLLDAPIWQRPDGALRADVTLPAGSAYTVVSERSGATSVSLRADGDIAALGAPPAFVQLPDSTTQRTRDLALQLASGSTSTYDTILAMQRWLGEHVVYDLEAPVPAAGRDAVDDFLFESQRGFCEQIATATAIMLRSLGIPVRVATGYVPSDRDEIAGVWISRASDAHAWVEVRFPSVGWVAFDPTASVPLSGEAGEATIGGDLVRALTGFVSDNIGVTVLVVIAGAFGVIAARLGLAWWRRRRRGRWGVLQDRFVAAAVRRGGPPVASNVELAAAFDDELAAMVAATLDESAFASAWVDDDVGYRRVATAVRVLERSGPGG